MAAVLVVVLSLAGVTWYLNRTITSDNPALGLLHAHLRWGRCHIMTVDSDRDGDIEGRYRHEREECGTSHMRADEAWEDFDNDGQVDTHWWYDENWDISLELDTDADGNFDKAVIAAAAEEHLKRRWRPKSPRME